MNHHGELSAELARALGWPHIRLSSLGHINVCESLAILPRMFDYRDPTVVLPLLEWLYSRNKWCSLSHTDSKFRWNGVDYRVFCSGHTIAEAVARAVIAVKVAERE